MINDIVPAAPHDLSFIGLFLQAGPIVKGVMIMLILASLVGDQLARDRSSM